MKKERIEVLKQYFYGEIDPICRLSITGGMWGVDIPEDSFSQLFDILESSINLEKDLEVFVESIHDFD